MLQIANKMLKSYRLRCDKEAIIHNSFLLSLSRENNRSEKAGAELCQAAAGAWFSLVIILKDVSQKGGRV